MPRTTKKKAPKIRITMTVEFDLDRHPESFGKFCEALIDGGFTKEVRAMAQELQTRLEELRGKA
jgi:hypothetical protein